MGLADDISGEDSLHDAEVVQQFLSWLAERDIVLVYAHNECHVEDYEDLTSLCIQFINTR